MAFTPQNSLPLFLLFRPNPAAAIRPAHNGETTKMPSRGHCRIIHVWIEMDVVCATLQIRFVTHGVFIKTPLPNTAFVPPLFAGRQVFGMREMCGEFGFNQPPAQGIIRIVGRQRPNGVNMVRQHAYGDGFKGILFLHIHISRTRSRYVRQAGAILGWRV